jgi:hypothetical protein
MKLLIVYSVLLLISCHPPTSQQSPAEPIDAVAVDAAAVRYTERMARQTAIESLAAGRRRWEQARVVEYHLQIDRRCFCVPDPDGPPWPLHLLTVRDGRIVKRSAGKGDPTYTYETSWTVTSLFDLVDSDLVVGAREVRRLELSPAYGFPVRYYAGRTDIEDDWIEIAIDSFAVIRPSPRSGRRRSR